MSDIIVLLCNGRRAGKATSARNFVSYSQALRAVEQARAALLRATPSKTRDRNLKRLDAAFKSLQDFLEGVYE